MRSHTHFRPSQLHQLPDTGPTNKQRSPLTRRLYLNITSNKSQRLHPETEETLSQQDENLETLEAGVEPRQKDHKGKKPWIPKETWRLIDARAEERKIRDPTLHSNLKIEVRNSLDQDRKQRHRQEYLTLYTQETPTEPPLDIIPQDTTIPDHPPEEDEIVTCL